MHCMVRQQLLYVKHKGKLCDYMGEKDRSVLYEFYTSNMNKLTNIEIQQNVS